MPVTGNKLAHIAVISAYLDLGDVQDPIKNDPSHNLVASCENNDRKKVYILVSKGHYLEQSIGLTKIFFKLKRKTYLTWGSQRSAVSPVS